MKTLLGLTSLIFSIQVFATTLVVELKNIPTSSELANLSKNGIQLELLANHESSYFKRTFTTKSLKTISEVQIQIEKIVKVAQIEQAIKPDLLNIIPATTSKMYVNDKLFPYQWALSNQGQSVLREAQTLQTKTYPGILNFDLNWTNVFTSFKALFKRKVTIAVLDTGVDYFHPEISASLLRNEVECNQPQGQEVKDLDNNGMIGDCLGWNFTRPKDSPRARDVMDFAGHGTHLVGIIGAQQNNNEGIAGISPDIQILPLKVVMEDGAEEDAQIDFSDRLAAAIVYSVRRGVDVINLSLGWPRSLDVKHLREAINLAQSQGIFIVAAAGNNNSEEPIFPCAYEGVVCVGASTIDGGAAGFSNFGSTVDLFAPGESILSTYPMRITPDVFHVPGYEFKSGTSQASPMVAATLALLKGQNPEEHPLKLLTRLFKNTKKLSKETKKFAAFGQISLEDSLKNSAIPFVRPQIKLLRQILFSTTNRKGSFNLPVLSHTDLEIPEVILTVESLTPSLQINTPEFKIQNLRKFEARGSKFDYEILNIEEEASVTLKITIKYGETQEIYINKLPLIRDLRNDQSVAVRKFKFVDRPLPVASLEENQLRTNISTIDMYYNKGEISYFMKRLITPKEGEPGVKRIEVTFFDRKQSTIEELPTKINLENATQLISILKVDANYDNVMDYMLQYVFDDGKTKSLKFLFLDKNLNPLYNELSTWNFIPDVAVINYSNLRFLKGDNNIIGKHLIPIFLTEGNYPTLDQNPSIWVRPITNKARRLYYLQPKIESTGVELQTRVITTTKWLENIQDQFALKWSDPVVVFDLFTQTEADFYNGVVNSIMLAGVSDRRTTQQMTLSSIKDFSYRTLSVTGSRIEAMSRKKLFNLDDKQGGDVFWNSYDQTVSRLMTFNLGAEQTAIKTLVHRNEPKSDAVLNHLASFNLDSSRVHFIQTKNQLLAVAEEEGKQKTLSRDMLRFSFLPGKLLSEMYYPIWTKSDDIRIPSLYVDSTQITGNRIYVMVYRDKKFIMPTKFSVFVPSMCKAMNPIQSQNDTFSYELLCLENNEWVFRSLNLM